MEPSDKSAGFGSGVLADGVGSEDDGGLDKLGKTRGCRRQGEFLLVAFARRTSEMAHQDDLRAMLHKIRDGGQSRSDARVVAYDAVFDGNVEIDAYEHTFPAHVHAFDGLYIGHDASYDNSSVAAVASCDRNVGTKLRTQAKSRPTPPMVSRTQVKRERGRTGTASSGFAAPMQSAVPPNGASLLYSMIFARSLTRLE